MKKISNYLVVLMLVCVTFLINIATFEYNGDKLVAYISVITSILSMYGIALAYYQFKEMKKQRDQELNIVQLSNSMDKMDEFREILHDCFLFTDIIDTDEKFKKLIESKDPSDFKSFRYDEFSVLYNKEERKYLMNYNALVERNFIKASLVYASSSMCDSKTRELIYEYLAIRWDEKGLRKKHGIEPEQIKNIRKYKQDFDILISKEGEGSTSQENEEKIKELRMILANHYTYSKELRKMKQLQSQIRMDIEELLNNLLNHLESWSMSFNIGLSDEDSVYPSLHQSYIATVKYFYPRICMFNDNNIKDHYYSNVINLYNTWQNKNDEIHQRYLEESQMKTKVRKKI